MADESEAAARWDAMYDSSPPWETGRPQGAFATLATAGKLAGRLLDIGCGTGENTLLAATRGADARGIDISARAIDRARAKAAERGIPATFDVADALRLDVGRRPGDDTPAGALFDAQFDVVIDSGIFHSFDDADRRTYVENLGATVRSGGRCYVLCFSDQTAGTWGPRRVSRAEISTAFDDGWLIESVESATFDVTAAAPVDHVDAWLVTLTRR